MGEEQFEKRRIWFSVVVLVLLLAIFVGLALAVDHLPPATHHEVQNTSSDSYKVSRFVDGDTIVVDNNGTTETVRLIGVDTPETHDPRKAVQCYGQAAANFTKSLIGNQPVRLETDSLSNDRDRYNRLLRYVYLPDGRLLNAELIEQGYGFAYITFPFTKSDEFQGYQRTARQNGVGLWSTCQPIKNTTGNYTSNDAL